MFHHFFWGGLLYFHQSIPGCFHPRPGLNGPQTIFFRKGCQLSAARSNSKSVEHSLLGNFDAEVFFLGGQSHLLVNKYGYI